jgi:hypothetical protein
MIEKVLFLIGNRHFLIRKCHFGIGAASYVVLSGSVALSNLIRRYSNDPPQSFHRRRRYRFLRSYRLLGYDRSEE